MAEQRDDVQSLRVDGPDPEMCGLQTPESIVEGSVRVRRKLPTPPVTDPREVEEHVRRTIDKLRTQRAFRRHLGGAQNSDSDSAISTIGLQNLYSITAPVVSGRRRMAANFPVSGRRTTGSAVINVDPTWGSKIVPLKSDKASFNRVRSPSVISGVPT